MKKIIILTMILATAFSLQAKKIEIGMHETNHTQLCEIFSDKVNRIVLQENMSTNDKRNMEEFMSRKKEHCSK